MVAEEVLLMNVGSEISYLLIERLRADAARGAEVYSNPDTMIGALTIGEGSRSGEMVFAECGVMGEARGLFPIAVG